MKDTLVPGITATWSTTVEPRHLVPALFPDDPLTAAAPRVLATPWLVAMIEYTAVIGLLPYLDEGEASVGTRIDLQHLAPSPEQETITLTATCSAVDSRQSEWSVIAHDSRREIGRAVHNRTVIDGRRSD